ncbi:MAG: ABC-F family ATP-binding cassette domain-containing protein [Anaerolineae bacterium]
MNLVTLERVSKHYGDRVLFEDVNLLINRGDRIGLIGINGSGKSTLLRVIAGLEPPDEGQVTVWGGVRVRFLPQEPHLDDDLTVLDHLFTSDAPEMRCLRRYWQLTERLQRSPTEAGLQEEWAATLAEMDRLDAWKAEARAKSILTQLGVTRFYVPVRALSGGQRKRVALARVLLDPGDLLILDEPTNHIDAEAIEWLEQYLSTVPDALLMVTHDRYFLERVVNRIVELDRRQMVNYPGNYQRYLELRAERHERLAAQELDRQRLLKRELEWLRRSPKARSTKQKARRERVRELMQIRYDLGEDTVAIRLATRRLGKKVLRARGLAKRYGTLTLFEGVDFDLGPGDRIGIVGPNGAGKSTFLDVLAGYVAPDAGTVEWGDSVCLGYYDQRGIPPDEDRRVIDYIEDEAPIIRTKDGERMEAARVLEWFLFSRPQQQAHISSLSGGERRRLYLLKTLIQQPNVLFLDEPTNDLDLQTLNVLESFLDHFKGSVVVVSHDRYFLDRTVDYLIHFEGGRVSPRYPTPFETFLRLKAEAVGAERPQREGRTSPPPPSRAPKRKLSWREQREMEELEARVEQLEQERAALHEEIERQAADFVALRELAERLQEVEQALDAALERWLALTEIAESEV